MTHPSFWALVDVMASLLPWQHHSYKTFNIARNVCYIGDIKLYKHFVVVLRTAKFCNFSCLSNVIYVIIVEMQ